MDPLKKYKDMGLNGEQLYQIELGKKNKVNVDVYANAHFTWTQMEQIRLGLEAGLDVSIYALSNIPADEMEHIKEKLLFQRDNPDSIERVVYVGNGELQVTRIISFVGLTDRCGVTTLIYYLTKLLNELRHETVAVELNNKDLVSFNNEYCFSVSKSRIKDFLLDHKSAEFILLDNIQFEQADETFVIYAHNPIQINKWQKYHRKEDLIGKKLILNKSIFTKSEIEKIELDIEQQFSAVVPYFNEFSYKNEVQTILKLLGITMPDPKIKRRWSFGKKSD
ncbi:hypothetical protein [Holdemania massiliensis]|uniref:hypothetical protein n=1 Tax=Holdemania massiliensis TaxID=1468449 RepID=UPI001F06E547|nr:hypothetical protein [Holdemania massiliensis]MCH1942434.1 hypothetical protein [Holdemania massiliensis]